MLFKFGRFVKFPQIWNVKRNEFHLQNLQNSICFSNMTLMLQLHYFSTLMCFVCWSCHCHLFPPFIFSHLIYFFWRLRNWILLHKFFLSFWKNHPQNVHANLMFIRCGLNLRWKKVQLLQLYTQKENKMSWVKLEWWF